MPEYDDRFSIEKFISEGCLTTIFTPELATILAKEDLFDIDNNNNGFLPLIPIKNLAVLFSIIGSFSPFVENFI